MHVNLAYFQGISLRLFVLLVQLQYRFLLLLIMCSIMTSLMYKQTNYLMLFTGNLKYSRQDKLLAVSLIAQYLRYCTCFPRILS